MDIIWKKSGRLLMVTSEASLLQDLERLSCDTFLFTEDVTGLGQNRGVCGIELMEL